VTHVVQTGVVDPVTVSIVIEWDNRRWSGDGRASVMLERLLFQVHELWKAKNRQGSPERDFLASLQPPVEIIVVWNDLEVADKDVRDSVRAVVPTDSPDVRLTFLPATGKRYYELKNIGFQYSNGQFVVFLDSDVIPEPQWLEHLLGSFANFDVRVVAGSTYLDGESLYDKSCALFWIFPLKTDRGALHTRRGLLANNLAVRRDTFVAFPFPDVPGTARVCCKQLARTLLANGVTIHENSAAQTRHPPPRGFRYFASRAIADGRDTVFLGPPPGSTSSHGVLRPFRARVISRMRAVCGNRRAVRLPLVAVPLALGIASVYFALVLAGTGLAVVAPGFMRRHFLL
jgi:hypothetical protein